MAIVVAPRTGEECLTYGPRSRIMCGPGPTEANDKLEEHLFRFYKRNKYADNFKSLITLAHKKNVAL